MKRRSRLYDHLQASGALNGTPAQIAASKRIYWNKRKAELRKEQRQRMKCISTVYNKGEYAVLTKAAARHHVSCTKYVHDASLAYATGTFLQLEPMTAHFIREGLLLTYHAVRDLKDSGGISLSVETNLLAMHAELEETISNALNNPKRLLTALQEAIISTPSIKQSIQEILNKN